MKKTMMIGMNDEWWWFHWCSFEREEKIPITWWALSSILSYYHTTYRALENRHIYLTQISTHPQNSYRMHFHTSTRKMKQVLIAYIYLEENGVDVEIRQVHRWPTDRYHIPGEVELPWNLNARKNTTKECNWRFPSALLAYNLLDTWQDPYHRDWNHQQQHLFSSSSPECVLAESTARISLRGTSL